MSSKMWDFDPFEFQQFEFMNGELQGACKCPRCGKKFEKRSKLMLHMTTRHTSLRSPNTTLFQCEHCPVKFIHSQSLQEHLQTHHPGGSSSSVQQFKFMCRHCEEKFDCDYKLWCHMVLHALDQPSDTDTCKKKYQCSKCAVKFVHKKDLRRHRKQYHSVVLIQLARQDKFSFNCDLCPEQFSRKKHLVRHLTHQHPGMVSPSASDSFEKQEKPYKCGKCDSRFAKRMYLKWHMNLHRQKSSFTTESLFDCLKCGTKFDLIAHQRWHLHSEKEKILRSQSERFTLDLSVVDGFGARCRKLVGNIGSALTNMVPRNAFGNFGMLDTMIQGVNKPFRDTSPNWYA